MDFRLSETESLIKKGAQALADGLVRPRATEIDRSGDFPHDIAQELGRLGYLGLPYPEAYGGAGAGYLAYALAIEELARGSMTVSVIPMICALAAEAIFRYGDEEQRQRFLSTIVSGKSLACFAFTEPATGSDPRAIETRAQPHGEGHLLYGEKLFITLAPVAKLAVIFAKDESSRVSAFIIDTNQPGFKVGRPIETMGLRGSATAPVTLDGVSAPPGYRLGAAGQGYEVLLRAISVGRVGVAAQSVGVAQAALAISLGYARRRTAYGRPIGELSTIKWLLAEMASSLEAARWLTYRTASLLDQGLPLHKEAAMAKLFASQMVVEVTRMAMQVHGAYGYTKDLPIERLYRDAKLTEIYEGVSEIQRVVIANGLLEEAE